MKIKLQLTLVLLISSLVINAQWGAQLGTTYIHNSVINPTIGVHINGIQLKERNLYQAFQFGLNLHMPFKFTKGGDYAVPLPNNPDKSPKPIGFTDKVKIIDLYAFYRFYLWGEPTKSGTLFVIVGGTISLEFSKIEPVLTDFDHSLYTPGINFSKANRVFVQPSLNLGAGYEKALKNNHIFGVQILYFTNTKLHTLDNASYDHAKSLVAARVTYSLPMKSKGESTTPVK